MTPAGVVVEARSTPPARSTPTSTGPAFLVGIFQKGKAAAAVTADDAITSMDDFLRELGARLSHSIDYDWVDTYFREGGNRLYPVRAVGLAALKAFRNLAGTAGTALKVEAESVGDWGNSLKVQVTNGTDGSTRIVKILNTSDVVLEQSPEFSDRLDAVDWSDSSDLVTITNGAGTGLPVVAASTALASGTDDHASVTITEVTAALVFLSPDLGPGQVVAPNWQTKPFHDAIKAHAATHNRFAACDAPDTASKGTLVTLANSERGTVNGDFGALMAPWLQIPGTAPSSSGRLVPASALFCARCAVTDVTDGPNQAPAGIFGQARYVTGVNATFARVTDTLTGINDADDLEQAGINLVIVDDGNVEFYGNWTLVDRTGPDQRWLQISNARYRMGLIARGRAVGKPFVFRRITSGLLGQIHQAIEDLLMRDFLNGDLFPDEGSNDPATAFNVNTDDVNDADTADAGEVWVSASVRPTKGASMVHILFTAVALTEPVA